MTHLINLFIDQMWNHISVNMATKISVGQSKNIFRISLIHLFLEFTCHASVHRVLSSEPRGLRTHRRSGRSRPLRSTVVEYQAPSVAPDSNFARGLVLQASTRAYLPFLPLPRTPSRLSSFRSTDGRTERVTERGRCLRTILLAVCGGGGGVCRGPPTTTLFGPQRDLPPARLVIHRTDLCQHNEGNAGRCNRGRAGVHLPPPPQHWLQITAELRITSARHGEAAAWEVAATPLSAKFRARNHSALEHIDIVVGHSRSGVSLSSTRLHQ